MLGSINSSIIVGKLFGIQDIRKHGSGNAGATNTLRTIGKRAAILALFGDVLKGVIAIILARLISGQFITESYYNISVLLSGLCVIFGHDFPLYFGFRGGKGILTSASVIYMLDWRIGIAVTLLALIIMATTKFVSLGSILSAASYFIFILIFYFGDYAYISFALIVSLLAILRHKQNIKRLIAGNENKLGAKKKN